jgi:hypothetical protein
LANNIPSLILSFEVALIAPFFVYAFPWKPYRIGYVSAGDLVAKPHQYYGGFLGIRAMLSAANIFDVFGALAKGIQAKFGQGGPGGGNQYGSAPTYYGPNDYDDADYRNTSQESYPMTSRIERGYVQNQ